MVFSDNIFDMMSFKITTHFTQEIITIKIYFRSTSRISGQDDGWQQGHVMRQSWWTFPLLLFQIQHYANGHVIQSWRRIWVQKSHGSNGCTKSKRLTSFQYNRIDYEINCILSERWAFYLAINFIDNGSGQWQLYDRII